MGNLYINGSADQAQIYRTLNELTRSGLVIFEDVNQSGRPSKKIYRLTETGHLELKNWLNHPVPAKEARNPELLYIFLSG